MAYKKTKAVRKPYKKPMRYKVADMAFTAFKGVKRIKQLINTESKYYDRTVSATIDESGVVYNLANIATGTGPTNRIGDSIKPQGFKMRATLQNNSSSTQTNMIRVIFFRYHYENAATPVTNDLLLNTCTASWRLLNLFTSTDRGRFTIISDKVHVWTQGKTSETHTKIIKESFKVPGHIKYETGTASCEHNGLYMLVLSNFITASAVKPTFEFTSRITFTDN